jgi:hypothetical protein
MIMKMNIRSDLYCMTVIILLYCGVFTPCKNCNIETRSRDYATVDEAVFSPYRAERSRDESRIVSHRVPSPRQATAINIWMTQEWGRVT